ncbi:response regulator transcription factor [Sutcliffiella horikoshii]|uniref:response regulator transcription factor n=1 Tax=Sutcliffiella horikoshii TaxID=79883 RepID=UPI0020414607|nr:response regulator transcription factor [Sutcliffiella horikoshii]MCM3619804.1 response regulator transcription factor [Sutcliffiella horikoshii]
MKISLVMERYQGEGLKTLLQIHFPECNEINVFSISTWKNNIEWISNSSILIVEPPSIDVAKEMKVIESLAKISHNLLLLSDKNEEEYILDCFFLGVKGILLKNNQLTTLLDAISFVMKGEVYVDQRVNRHILSKLFEREKHQVKNTQSLRPTDLLTHKEWEILEAMALDLTNKEIAKVLFVSEPTVHNYSTSIQKKLNVNSRVGAVVKSISEGWISTEVT